MNKKIWSVFIFTCIIFSKSGLAQSKRYVYPNSSNDLIRQIEFPELPSLVGKKILYNGFIGIYKDSLDDINSKYNKNYDLYKKNPLESFDSLLIADEFLLQGCTFLSTCYLQNIITAPNNNDPYFKPVLRIENCSIRKNVILNTSTNIEINNSQSEYAYIIDGCTPRKLIIENNTVNSGNVVASIKNSNLEYVFLFYNSALQGTNYYFENDTIRERIFLSGKAVNAAIKLHFNDCYIDCRFDEDARKSSVVYIFKNCKFGPNFEILNNDITGLTFINCNFTSKINLNSTRRPLSLFVENSDLSKLEFNYTGKIKITYPEDYAKDNIKSLYENLLSKFKTEGKVESYEILDIEYQKFNENWFAFTLSKIWWNHGYNKSWIVLWTIFFIVVFWIFNMSFWSKIYSEYPINDKNFNKTSVFNFIDYVLKTLIFTLAIFFALKIDINTIKFKRPWVVCVLCLQYLVGLLCMVFIVNAILKF